MNKTHIYDLAYEFRNSKVWKQIFENELFAVKLPSKSKKTAGDKIAYCYITGRGGEHMSLTVYPGAESFTSFRKFVSFGEDHEPVSAADLLILDCVQCSIESRDQFGPVELEEIKAYCRKAGITFRAPFPQITRYYPCCLPWNVSKADDWKALEAALAVTVRLAGELKRSGKTALGLRPVTVGLRDEAYAAEQMSLFEESSEDEVTVPLYSIVDGNLVIEHVSLPPYTERTVQPPTRFNDISMARMMRNKQRGTYQCEIIRLPEPVDGDPPYVPAALMTVDPNGLVLSPAVGSGPVYDPDEMLNEFIANLGSAYPKVIKVRTAETKTLLEEFCQKTEIRLTETKKLDLLDEAVDSLTAQMGYDYDDDDDEEDSVSVDEMIEMLGAMSVEQMRMLPNVILDQILNVAQFFPEEIVKKVRKARGKRS